MTPRPLVSVITPVYNGEKFLEETLLSIFSQTYQNYELIVVDDGSPSRECEAICRKYLDKMKYIPQANTGLSGARNRGLKEAKGEYIAFIDQDDLWMPEKLEKQVALFESLKSKGVPVGLVYTPLIEIDAEGKEVGRTGNRMSGNIFAEAIYTNNVGTPSSVMVAKEVFDRVGGFSEDIKSYSDWELFIRISVHYEVHCLDEFLARYRITRGSLSGDLSLMDRDVRVIAKKVYKTYPEYFKQTGLTRRGYIQGIRNELATIWKYAAYRKLVFDGDGPGYRLCIRKGWARSRKVIGFKPWIHFGLSYVSVALCQRLSGFRKKT